MKRTSIRRVPPLLVTLLLVPLALAGCAGEREPSYYGAQLGHPKEELRRRAVEELRRLQNEALPVVEEALESEDPVARENALKVLDGIRRMQSLQLAGDMLDDPEAAVRIQAIRTISALAQVWKEQSVQLLSQALQSEDSTAVRLAVHGLADMNYDRATDVLRETFQRAEGIQAIYAAQMLYEVDPIPEAARVILENLDAQDPQIRAAAEESVLSGETGGLRDRIVPALINYVDEHPQAGAARGMLRKVRESLIAEISKILDPRRASQILVALGRIADRESVEKLKTDLNNTRLESSWRLAAARGLGIAARSERIEPSLRQEIISFLNETVDRQGTDNRVRIGAAIALAQLRQEAGVNFLLDTLERFQTTAEGGQADRGGTMTALRINAQEALTESGDYVVDFLLSKLQSDPGPIMIWAAAKTLGELGVERAVPHLARFLTALRRSQPRMSEDGQPVPQPVTLSEEGIPGQEVELENWQDPDPATVRAWQQRLEVVEYPAYVRWTCARALGRIGSQQARDALQKAEAQEVKFLQKLRANKRNYEPALWNLRAPIIDGLIRQHEEVLFYIRAAQERMSRTAGR